VPLCARVAAGPMRGPVRAEGARSQLRWSCVAGARQRCARDACSVYAVGAALTADVTATCVGLGLAVAIGLISGLWVVGPVVGVAVGVALADKMRLRAGLPRRQLLSPRGRNDRNR
jgi:hypothetical protein